VRAQPGTVPAEPGAILTRNEILAALNSPDAYHLAVVRVEHGFAHTPQYVRHFVTRELGFAETAVVFSIAELLKLGRQSSRTASDADEG
jgi:hypothetical protein